MPGGSFESYGAAFQADFSIATREEGVTANPDWAVWSPVEPDSSKRANALDLAELLEMTVPGNSEPGKGIEP